MANEILFTTKEQESLKAWMDTSGEVGQLILHEQLTPPAVSAPGHAVMYWDDTLNVMLCSVDGGAFVPCVAAAAGPGAPVGSTQFNDNGAFGGDQPMHVAAFGTDRQAIQDAIDAAPVGGTVQLDCIDYVLDGTTVTIDKSVTLTGCGPQGGGVFTPTPTAGTRVIAFANETVFTIDTLYAVTIENLYLKAGPAGVGILITATEPPPLGNLFSVNVRSQIRNNWIDGAGYAILAAPGKAAETIIENNYLSDFFIAGIRLQGLTNPSTGTTNCDGGGYKIFKNAAESNELGVDAYNFVNTAAMSFVGNTTAGALNHALHIEVGPPLTPCVGPGPTQVEIASNQLTSISSPILVENFYAAGDWEINDNFLGGPEDDTTDLQASGGFYFGITYTGNTHQTINQVGAGSVRVDTIVASTFSDNVFSMGNDASNYAFKATNVGYGVVVSDNTIVNPFLGAAAYQGSGYLLRVIDDRGDVTMLANLPDVLPGSQVQCHDCIQGTNPCIAGPFVNGVSTTAHRVGAGSQISWSCSLGTPTFTSGGLSSSQTGAENRAALTAMLAALPASGGRIQLPAGSFSLDNTPVVIDKPCTIEGATQGSPSGTAIVSTATTTDVFFITTSQGVSFRDLTIAAAGTITTGAFLHYHASPSNVGSVIENVVLSGCQTCIDMEGAKSWRITNANLLPRVHTDAVGIHQRSTEASFGGFSIDRVSVTNGSSLGTAVLVTSGSNTNIVDNAVFGMARGVVIDWTPVANGGAFKISRNTFGTTTQPILLETGTSAGTVALVEIDQNIFTGATPASVRTTPGASYLDVTLTGNQIVVDPATTGFDLGLTNANIVGNLFQATGGGAIGLNIQASAVGTNYCANHFVGPFASTIVDAGAGTTSCGGGPSLPDTSVQFNDGGNFGGDTHLLWDDVLKRLQVGSLPNGTLATGPLVVGVNIASGVGTQAGLFQTTSGTAAGEGLVTLGNDNVAVSGWAFRGTGSVNPLYGGNFGVHFTRTGQVRGVEIDVQNEFADTGIGTFGEHVGLWLNRSGTFNNSSAIEISSQDNRGWWHGIHFDPGGAGTGSDTLIKGWGIRWFRASSAQFISMVPADDFLPSANAIALYAFDATTEKAKLNKRGQWFSRGDDTGVAEPAYTFIDEPTTGIYMPAAGQLGMAVTGTEVFKAVTSPVTGTLTHGYMASFGTTFASLGAVINGAIIYCSDCAQTTPCTGGGTGAFAQGINAAWACTSGAGSAITGTGTTNTMTKWTGASSLGNSGTTDDGSVIVSSLPVTTPATIDIKRFGAVGNGIANDTAAIQLAINAAQTSGAEILCSPGHYSINAALAVTKPIKIRGTRGIASSAETGCIILASNATQHLFTVDIPNVGGYLFQSGALVLEDITLDASVVKTAGAGVYLTNSGAGCSSAILDRVRIFNQWDGVGGDKHCGTTITNSRISEWRNVGVHLENQHEVDGGNYRISNSYICSIATGSTTAIEWHSGGDVTIIGNAICAVGAGTFGIDMFATNGGGGPSVHTSQIMVVGNEIESPAVGIRLVTDAGCSMARIALANNAMTGIIGIQLGEVAPNSLSAVTMTGNVMANDTCFDFEGGSEFSVNGNDCGFNTHAFSVASAATLVYIGTNSTFKNGTTATFNLFSTTAAVEGLYSETFTTLPTTIRDRSVIFCSDCDPTATLLACTHVGAQTGAFAYRVNGAWKCMG